MANLRRAAGAGGAAALVAIGLGCGSQSLSSSDAGLGDASLGGAGEAGLMEASEAVDSGPTPACDGGWRCNVDTTCATATTLTGKVFDPAGLDPLYDAVVFVPVDSQRMPAVVPGSPTCTQQTIGDYVSATLTGTSGTFTLHGVPTGRGVPVTVQVGKWRRTVFVDVLADCAANAVADGVLRLPRNHGEGDLPQMALLTGGADDMACFLRGVGVDASEFGPPGGGGRVDVYRGVGGADLATAAAPDCTGAACPLWTSPAALGGYDVLLLGCEGTANLQTKPPAALQAMHDWLGAGGKLFGVHSEDVWLSQGSPDFSSSASWVDGPASGATGPFTIDTSFAQGALFRQWASLTGVANVDGGIPIAPGDVATSVASVNGGARSWIHDESASGVLDGATTAGSVKAFSVAVAPTFDAGLEQATCGRALLTDIHPGGSSPHAPIPGACPLGPRTAADRALEFLLFDELVNVPPPPPCACLPPPPPAPDGG